MLSKVAMLIFPLILSILSYFGENIHYFLKSKSIENKLFSFASGVLITFIFMSLLPDLFKGTQHLDEFLYFFVLTGFTTFLLIHEYLYKYESNKSKLNFELKESHTLVSFCFHFLIGTVLITLIRFETLPKIIVIFIPIAVHVTFSSLASYHITRAKNYSNTFADKLLEFLIITSPLLGAIFALIFELSIIVTYSLYGVIGGVILFVVIREFIPKPKEAELVYFILGQIFFVLLSLIKFIA